MAANSFDVLIVIGPCGVGKSSLLNTTFGTEFKTGPGGEHVTTKSKEVCVKGGIRVVDTPGFDLDSGNLPPLSKYSGLRVAIVFLGWARKDVYQRKAGEKLGVAKRFINFFSRGEEDNAGALRDAIDNQELEVYQVPSQAGPSSGVKKKKKKGKGTQKGSQKKKVMFLGKGRLHGLLDFSLTQPLSAPTNLMDLVRELILNRDDVDQYRYVGDAVVGIFSQSLVLFKGWSKDMANSINTNEHMVATMDKIDSNLVAYAIEIYDGDRDISDETKGNVFEAIIGKLVVTPRLSKGRSRIYRLFLSMLTQTAE